MYAGWDSGFKLVDFHTKQMKIQEININLFKRLKDLTMTDVPETTKLVVFVGPNGSGKTSIFEALCHYYKFTEFNYKGERLLRKKGWWSIG